MNMTNQEQLKEDHNDLSTAKFKETRYEELSDQN